MQGQDTQKSNVVSLFESRKKSETAETAVSAEGAPVTAQDAESFGDVMKQNAKNKERLEKERLSANKSVLRSYRIKH